MSIRDIDAMEALQRSYIRIQHCQDIGAKIFNLDPSMTAEIKADLKKNGELLIELIKQWKDAIPA